MRVGDGAVIGSRNVVESNSCENRHKGATFVPRSHLIDDIFKILSIFVRSPIRGRFLDRDEKTYFFIPNCRFVVKRIADINDIFCWVSV